jgi:hypothetical protein
MFLARLPFRHHLKIVVQKLNFKKTWLEAGRIRTCGSFDDHSDNLQSIGSRNVLNSNKLQTKVGACAPTVAFNHSATASTKNPNAKKLYK